MHHQKDHLGIHCDDFDLYSTNVYFCRWFQFNDPFMYLRRQFSLDNPLNVGDNILCRLRGAVEVGDVAFCDALVLLLHGILLILVVEVPLEASLARIKSNGKMLRLIEQMRS